MLELVTLAIPIIDHISHVRGQHKLYSIPEITRTHNVFILSAKDGWTDKLRFYIIFNSISVTLGQWKSDNERLCAMFIVKWISASNQNLRLPEQQIGV